MMTTEETTILTNMLTLGNKVLANDPSVEDAVNAINVITTNTSDYDSLINDDVRGIIEKSTAVNKAVTIKIIDGLTSVVSTKDVLLGLLEVKTLNISDSAAVRAFIDSALTSTINDFSYYNFVVKIAIILGDSSRIQSTIRKIQGLGV